MSDNAAAVAVLQQWAKEQKLSQVTWNDNTGGTSLTLGDVTLEDTETALITYADKICEYSLASFFLQIVDPEQGLVNYRSACKKDNVKDPVKASDKAAVVAFFLGGEEEGEEAEAADGGAAATTTVGGLL
jgi:hypothetical protein